MKRLLTLIIASIMLVGVISITFAGGVQEETFLEELEGKLVEEGFTDEEIADFMEAAEEIDWADAENSNLSVVAKSLVQLKRDNEGLEAQEQARIAHSFATELEETEEEEGDEVSQAAQQAVEELKEQIRQWQEDGEEEELGELVRNTVREQVQEAAQEKKQSENQEGPSEDSKDSSKGSEGDEADEASEESEGTGDKGLDKADEKAPQSKSGK